MNEEKLTVFKLLEDTIGTQIKIISSDYQEMPVSGGQINTHQKIVFQIKEEELGGRVTLTTRNKARGAESGASPSDQPAGRDAYPGG